jgi:hypothetical protein
MPGRPIVLIELYLKRLLKLFIEKAAMYHKSSERAYLEDMQSLAKIIKVLCDHEGFREGLSQGFTAELLTQLRNMWFYLVLFVLDADGSWPKDWSGIVKILALRTPPLILDKNSKSLAVDLGSNSVLIGSFPESVIQH